MQWIKRNLFLVVGGAVALGLLGLAGFYLLTKIQQDKTVTEQLDAATQKLETLAKRDPYPNPENIKSAKEEEDRLQKFLGNVEKHFASAPYPKQLSPMDFRTYLESTRAELTEQAQHAGVELPTNYWFSFSAQKSAMTFSAGSLEPLASQVADIKAICEVLFDAKINSLVWLRRVPSDSQADVAGSQDYLSSKPTTNNWSVMMPYEVTFQGFSAQLGSVLEGLVHSPYCYVVTNIVVEPASSATAGPSEQQSAPPPGLANPPAVNPYSMAARYGNIYNRMRGMPTPQPVVQVQTGPKTILDEKSLRFTLSVQAIRLKPKTAKK